MNRFSIMVVSNIVLEPYFTPMFRRYFGEGCDPIFFSFEEYLQTGSAGRRTDSFHAVILWLNFETLFPKAFLTDDYNAIKNQQAIEESLAIFKMLLAEVGQYGHAPVYLLLFEDFYRKTCYVSGHRYNRLVDQVNTRIDELTGDRAITISLKAIIAEVGTGNAYNNKNKYRWNSPYSARLMEAVTQEIYRQHLIHHGITPKCLVLDCDNVLWGGMLSEDGVDGIWLGSSGRGREFQEFQRFLLFLYYHGVILAVCSKNDEDDVLEVFREHPEMVLKEKHVACFRVNWGNKADNIRDIAATLNIGLDSMVFVDDSCFEVESIREILPEVTAIRYERDTIYQNLSCFHLDNDVDIMAVEQRTMTYKTDISRGKLRDITKSFSEYLDSLKMEIAMERAVPIEYGRIAELAQRANKCTNGARYSLDDIKDKSATSGFCLYSVKVSDRFSNLGIVGAMAVEEDRLLLFVLSCRALGRGIEDRMMMFLSVNHTIKAVDFFKTEKNEDIRAKIEAVFGVMPGVLDDTVPPHGK